MSILNSPITINGVALSGRLVMPPMATDKSGANGEVSQALCDYYRARSLGGHIGLVITEHSYVSREGQAGKDQLSISKDGDVEGLAGLVSVIHQSGTKVVAQLAHAGSAADSNVTGCEVFSASASSPSPGKEVREMTLSDIEKVVADFARAAARAKQAGFDGVEIHSAHGYLLNQFFSPLTNKRSDAYQGQSMEGRLRLHLEILEAIRKVVGREYLVALRLGASDYKDGGTTAEDGVKAAVILDKAGIDLLDVSGGFCGYRNPNSRVQGYFSELTEAIKRRVGIPVMLTGGIIEAQAAEDLLSAQKADLIGVGRALYKDAGWAQRAMQALDKP